MLNLAAPVGHLTARQVGQQGPQLQAQRFPIKHMFGTSSLCDACLGQLSLHSLPPPPHPVPRLCCSAAAHLGLPEGLLVAQGGSDAFIGMVGLGVVRAGQMAMLTGGRLASLAACSVTLQTASSSKAVCSSAAGVVVCMTRG
jgi:ribulose kinase